MNVVERFREGLRREAGAAGVELSTELTERLEAYYLLLVRWNERINLVGFDPRQQTPEMFGRLFVEPLIAAQHVPKGRASMIDIGTGGGSPAIPLALASRVRLLRMVESRSRKSTFLREAARAVGLENAEVLTKRAEELGAASPLAGAHEVLSIRAVRLDQALLRVLSGLLTPDGQMLLFRSTSDPVSVAPPLTIETDVSLDRMGQSRLIILRAANVPRGTS